MKIRAYHYGIGAAILSTALVTGMFKHHDNSSDKNYANRLKNMEYVKQNNYAKYVNALETINKSKSMRISPEYIDNIWEEKAKEVKDSIIINNMGK